MHVQGTVPMEHDPEPVPKTVPHTSLRPLVDRSAQRNTAHVPAPHTESALSGVLSVTGG